VAADPQDASAHEMLALALAEQGDNSALDTVAVALRLARDPATRLRITVSAAWLQLGAALSSGDPNRARAIGGMVDSLIRTNPPPAGNPLLLTALAALTGHGVAAAGYARQPEMDRAFGVEPTLRASASPLLLYSALGGPADSVHVLERAVTTAIETTRPPARRANERLAVLARAATLAYPAHRLRALTALVGQGDGLLDMQAALDRGDLAFVRDSLSRLGRTRRDLAPEMITLDGIAPELRLLVALGDLPAAERWVDPTLAAIGQLIPRLRTRPLEAASLVPILIQRAHIAARRGEHANADRFARFARILWSGADTYLRPRLDSLPSPL
jgi:hypothetical protein